VYLKKPSTYSVRQPAAVDATKWINNGVDNCNSDHDGDGDDDDDDHHNHHHEKENKNNDNNNLI